MTSALIKIGKTILVVLRTFRIDEHYFIGQVNRVALLLSTLVDCFVLPFRGSSKTASTLTSKLIYLFRRFQVVRSSDRACLYHTLFPTFSQLFPRIFRSVSANRHYTVRIHPQHRGLERQIKVPASCSLRGLG